MVLRGLACFQSLSALGYCADLRLPGGISAVSSGHLFHGVCESLFTFCHAFFHALALVCVLVCADTLEWRPLTPVDGLEPPKRASAATCTLDDGRIVLYGGFDGAVFVGVRSVHTSPAFLCPVHACIGTL